MLYSDPKISIFEGHARGKAQLILTKQILSKGKYYKANSTILQNTLNHLFCSHENTDSF